MNIILTYFRIIKVKGKMFTLGFTVCPVIIALKKMISCMKEKKDEFSKL